MSSTDVSQLSKADIPRLHDVPVVAADGEEIGHVKDAYYDEESDRLEAVGVPGGFLGLSTRVIPVAGATLDAADGRLRLPFTREQIEKSPDWDDDDREERYDDRYAEMRRHYDTTEPEDQALTRSEEELAVGKRSVEAGKMRLRKWVETEPVEADVELRRETAEVRREQIDRPVGDVELREEEIEVPLHEEQAVVEKRTVAKERVSVEKGVDTPHERIADEVRKERVEVEEDR